MSNILIPSDNTTDRRGFFRHFLAQTPEIAEHNEKFNLNQERFDEQSFIGEIMICAFDFAPRGWALCNGQLLAINQNAALFSLLGTTYGGNGATHFALPNFQGRSPIHQGQGAGLSNRTIGQVSGASTHTLTAAEMPQHNHSLSVPTVQALGTGTQITGLAQAGALGTTAAITVGNAGGNLSHNNMPPYLVLNFCIATTGLFPTRA
jgi:microcystin-dependent protein